jgi:hypothetical protein
VLDDTCYHLSCESEREARFLARLLNADCCRELLSALVFWDAKRPITSEVLQRIELRQVAFELGLSSEWAACSLASSGQPAVR